MVKIFSGDDTDFKGDQRLALTFAAPDVDFDGCTAEVEFLGQRRTFAQVTNGGRLVFSFTADETRGMRCGVWPVIIRLRDSAGRVRTVNNTNRIKVTNDVNEAYADQEQELAVALTSGGVALPEIPAELDAEASDSVGDFKRKYNSLLELLRNVAALAVMFGAFATFAASVATAPLDDIPGTAHVVTNVSLDGVAMATDIPSVAGVVHGDDRADDKAAFPQGLKLRMSDTDGGTMRLRIQDPMDNGITWYSDSSDTTLGSPFLKINCWGIRHPTDISAETFTLTSWADFTRTHTVLDTMPGYVLPGGSGRENYIYPISAGAFLDYFWNIYNLPTAAANRFADTRTMKAASNLVDRAGAFVRAEDIEVRAAELAATSTVPVLVYSAWATDWPSDDESQPTQPVFTNGAWAVWIVSRGTKYGPYTAQGYADATNLSYTIYGYTTAFWREATIAGDLNAYGMARYKDLDGKQDALPYPTNAIPHTAISGMPEGVTPQAVTNIIRDISRGGIWDEALQVWWTPVMSNGSLTYQATTNVNLNAEN